MTGMSTRRDFFRQLAALTGGAGSAATLTGIHRTRRGDRSARGQHLSGCRARGDPDAGESLLRSRLRDAARRARLQRSARGHAAGSAIRCGCKPMPPAKPTRPSAWTSRTRNATWLGSLPHSWRDQTDARNHGNHDAGWTPKPRAARNARACRSRWATTTAQDIPFYYALADAFTICDQHFCSSLTGTTPTACTCGPARSANSRRRPPRPTCGTPTWTTALTAIGRPFPNAWKTPAFPGRSTRTK